MKKSANDQVLVIGAGVTLHEALTAAGELAKSGVHIRVLDPFTVKPLDAQTIIANAKECGGRILTVEDHYPQGKIILFKFLILNVIFVKILNNFSQNHLLIDFYFWNGVHPMLRNGIECNFCKDT